MHDVERRGQKRHDALIFMAVAMLLTRTITMAARAHHLNSPRSSRPGLAPS